MTIEDEQAPALATMVVASVCSIPVAAGLTAAVGASWRTVVVLALLAPTASTLLIAGVLLVRRRDRAPAGVPARTEPAADLPARPRDVTAERRAAAWQAARDLEVRLEALTAGGPEADLDDLQSLVSALHEARLRAAETVLRDTGALPAPLADELLSQHRQFLAVLEHVEAQRQTGGATG